MSSNRLADRYGVDSFVERFCRIWLLNKTLQDIQVQEVHSTRFKPFRFLVIDFGHPGGDNISFVPRIKCLLWLEFFFWAHPVFVSSRLGFPLFFLSVLIILSILVSPKQFSRAAVFISEIFINLIRKAILHQYNVVSFCVVQFNWKLTLLSMHHTERRNSCFPIDCDFIGRIKF